MGRKWWIVAGVVVAALFWTAADAAPVESKPVFTQPESTGGKETAVAEVLEFPIVISGTELIIQHSAGYEGPFLEDSTQEPVSEVMGLMVYNPTPRYVQQAVFQLQQGGRTLFFEITYLPPGSRVLVLEKNGQLYSKDPVHACCCLSLLMLAEPDKPEIAVQEGEGKLTVSNTGQEAAEKITVYYKQYYEQEGFYLGGRTDSVEIRGLLSGQSRELVPYRYVCGYSRIVLATSE